MSTEENKPIYDVFISHAGPDKVAAESLCEELESYGLRCWIAPRNVRAGFNYPEEIIEGVIRSKSLLLLLSEDTKLAGYVENEVERAKSYGRKIYTLRLDDVPIPKNLELFLGLPQWIDSWSTDYPERIQQLVANLKQTGEPDFTPKTTTFWIKLLRISRKNALGIATICILLFFLVKFFSGPMGPDTSEMHTAIDGISELSADNFETKVDHYSFADTYRIQFIPNSAGLTINPSLITKQYYFNVTFDNGTSLRELSGFIGAQFEIPKSDKTAGNVELILESLDGEKSEPLNYAIPQLAALLLDVTDKQVSKLISRFNSNGQIYCTFMHPFFRTVKVCRFGGITQEIKYSKLKSFVKYITFGENKDDLNNKVNLQNLETQGIAGFNHNDSADRFEFFIPMTHQTHYYQVEYTNGDYSPVFELSSSSSGQSHIYKLASNSPDATPLYLSHSDSTQQFVLLAATNNNVKSSAWQVYPNINNALDAFGKWYNSKPVYLHEIQNSEETISLIETRVDGTVVDYQYSLNFNAKLNDQRLAKNKQQVDKLYWCDSFNCHFQWRAATQEDINNVEDILIGVASNQLVSITNGDIEKLNKSAERQRLILLAEEEARVAKLPKPKELSFGTKANSSSALTLVERLRLPTKFEVRKDWKVREQGRISRFISYSFPPSQLFIQFKWIDGSYSKVMVMPIVKNQ